MKRTSALSAELVELVAQRAKRARVVLSGSSMQPLLRAGMVVDIEPLGEPPRIGEVLVFRTPSGLVAHRLVGGDRFMFRAHSGIVAHLRRDEPAPGFVTSGDAFPDRVESVPPRLVVGRVTAVWASDAPDARRIDDPRYYRLGAFFARTHALRSLLAKARIYRAMVFVDPARLDVPAAFSALVAATRKFERGDYATGVSLLDSIPRRSAIDMARRHHASGLIWQWLDEAVRAGVPVPEDLREVFRRIRWTNAIQAGRVLACVSDVRDRFAAADIPHIFLKGGARLGAGEPGADLQFSGDVDVIVPPDMANRALAVLRGAGYQDVRPEPEREVYTRLHHREPLWSPQGGVPVEIHVSLAPPGVVSRRLDFAALASSSRRVSGPAGELSVLDKIASALHLAYHARDLHVWRDVVLLSRSLRSFDATERARFDAYVRAEKRDGLRLESVVAAADRILSDQTVSKPAVTRYLSWAEIREDIPRRFAHVDFVEAYVGRCPVHVFRLDRSRRNLAGWLRSWTRNLVLLPAVVRITRRRARRAS